MRDTSDLEIPERSDQIIDRARRHTGDVGLHHHCVQRPVDAAAVLKDRREERALAQLRDAQLDVTRLGGQKPRPMTVPRVTEGMVAELETQIDRFEDATPPLKTFILPGGTALGAQLHLARTVCRRAERAVIAASGKEQFNPDAAVYLNRLSDLLFTLARAANHRVGHPETPWNPR